MLGFRALVRVRDGQMCVVQMAYTRPPAAGSVRSFRRVFVCCFFRTVDLWLGACVRVCVCPCVRVCVRVYLQLGFSV